MARRVRDYAAEYARRKELHPGNLTEARGHGSRERESVERRLRGLIERENVRVDDRGRIIRNPLQEGRKPSLRGVITNENQSALDRYLRDQKAASRAYERGDYSRGRSLWRSRDPSLPEWLFWYHGVYGRAAPRTVPGSSYSCYGHGMPHGSYGLLDYGGRA